MIIRSQAEFKCLDFVACLLIKIEVYFKKTSRGNLVKSKRALFYLLLLGFGLLLSCGGERNYSVETKNGIRFVHNRQPDSSESATHLEFVRKIGEMESEDENFMFNFPIHVARDVDGQYQVMLGCREALPC